MKAYTIDNVAWRVTGLSPAQQDYVRSVAGRAVAGTTHSSEWATRLAPGHWTVSFKSKARLEEIG